MDFKNEIEPETTQTAANETLSRFICFTIASWMLRGFVLILIDFDVIMRCKRENNSFSSSKWILLNSTKSAWDCIEGMEKLDLYQL